MLSRSLIFISFITLTVQGATERLANTGLEVDVGQLTELVKRPLPEVMEFLRGQQVEVVVLPFISTRKCGGIVVDASVSHSTYEYFNRKVFADYFERTGEAMYIPAYSDVAEIFKPEVYVGRPARHKPVILLRRDPSSRSAVHEYIHHLSAVARSPDFWIDSVRFTRSDYLYWWKKSNSTRERELIHAIRTELPGTVLARASSNELANLTQIELRLRNDHWTELLGEEMDVHRFFVEHQQEMNLLLTDTIFELRAYQFYLRELEQRLVTYSETIANLIRIVDAPNSIYSDEIRRGAHALRVHSNDLFAVTTASRKWLVRFKSEHPEIKLP